MNHARARLTLAACFVVLAAVPAAFAGFAGTEVFLPSVGSGPGVAPGVWYTTVWVYNPGSRPANVTFSLLERTANLSPRTFTDTIPAGDTRRWDDAVQSMFGVQTFGALRVTSSVKLMVGSRIYSQIGAAVEDSTGQFFAGIPGTFSIGSGESTEVIGGWQTQPAASSAFRFNYGFVETTGRGTCQVRVSAVDHDGAVLGTKTYALRQWEQLQRSFATDFPSLSSDNLRLTVEVTSGTGVVWAPDEGLTLPYQASSSTDASLFSIENHGHGVAINGGSPASARTPGPTPTASRRRRTGRRRIAAPTRDRGLFEIPDDFDAPPATEVLAGFES